MEKKVYPEDVYKAVKHYEDTDTAFSGPRSWIYTEGSIGVEYQLGKWVKPKIPGSPLFAFDSLSKTLDFMYAGTNLTFMKASMEQERRMIYRCKAVLWEPEIEEREYVLPVKMPFSRELIEEHWKEFKEAARERRYYYTEQAPLGTFLCAEILPVEKVPEFEFAYFFQR